MVNTFSWCHFWPSIQTRLSLFFLQKKKMYSQNDETGVLEVLEINFFFAAQPWSTDFYIDFFQNYFRGFYNSIVAYLQFY